MRSFTPLSVVLAILVLAASAGSEGREDTVERVLRPVIDEPWKGSPLLRGVPRGPALSVGAAFETPRGTWWLEAVSICVGLAKGARPGPRDHLTVQFMSPRMRLLHEIAVPLGDLATKGFGWHRVPLDKVLRAGREIVVVLRLDAHLVQAVHIGRAPTTEPISFWAGRNSKRHPREDYNFGIRVTVSKRKPRWGSRLKDLAFIRKTVAKNAVGLREKNIPWEEACRWAAGRLRAAADDRAAHLVMAELLGVLKDGATRIVTSRASPGTSPTHDWFEGGGLWIAADGDRFVLRASPAPGHPLAGRLAPGAVLLSVGRLPAPIQCQNLAIFLRTERGFSSRQALRAALGTGFFFREGREKRLTFLDPGGKVVEVEIPEAGRVSPIAATMPTGLSPDGAMAAGMLGDDIGYLRILPPLDPATEKAVDAGLATLAGARGVLLDLRGAGGEDDDVALRVAGRFFTKPFVHGGRKVVAPAGPRPYGGPLVLLQDAAVSGAAEWLAALLSETGRATTVGARTSGTSLRTRTFSVPSKSFSFRLGVALRRTPVGKEYFEGAGIPADVPVPLLPVLFESAADPVRAMATDVLRHAMAGADMKIVSQYLAAILYGLRAEIDRVGPAFARIPKPKGLLIKGLDPEFSKRRIAWERSVAEHRKNGAPDHAGLVRLCRDFGIEPEVSWVREAEAQRSWRATVLSGFPPSDELVAAFLTLHGRTRWGRTVREQFPPERK